MSRRIIAPRKTSAELAGGDPQGRVTRPDALRVRASTEILVKDVGIALTKAYPGWRWNIEAGDTNNDGVIRIRSDRLHPTWGYVDLIENIQNLPSVYSWALKAGGEILERFRCKAGPYRPGCLDDVPKDMHGRPMPDLSGEDRAKQIRQQKEYLFGAQEAGRMHKATVRAGGEEHSFMVLDRS